jgi:hypothetical protein
MGGTHSGQPHADSAGLSTISGPLGDPVGQMHRVDWEDMIAVVIGERLPFLPLGSVIDAGGRSERLFQGLRDATPCILRDLYRRVRGVLILGPDALKHFSNNT